MFLSVKQRKQALQRARHINSLTSNVGLVLEPYVPVGTQPDSPTKMMWVIQVYDAEGVYGGVYNSYKHERSAVRAIWRLYREQTGD